ncbi:MAG: hypothetical protein DWQ08_12765, partial [Proteobacteria bacterium]
LEADQPELAILLGSYLFRRQVEVVDARQRDRVGDVAAQGETVGGKPAGGVLRLVAGKVQSFGPRGCGKIRRMTTVRPTFQVTMSGVDKLMPDVDILRVFESRLVHQLDRGRVVYCTHSCLLYYWEPADGRVRRIVENAMRSVGRAYADAPVIMDNKGVFNKPRKVRMSAPESKVVAAALRLAGIEFVVNNTRLAGRDGSKS